MDDLKHAGERGWKWDLSKAQRAFGFFENILHLNGGEFEGEPFLLQPWEKFFVGSIFGWVDDAGFRRYQVVYAEIGKGNGKSPLAAGIGHYCLTYDDEPRAEVYAAASKRDQAMVLFRDAVAMVQLSPELAKRVRAYGGGSNTWNLVYGQTHSFFRAIASEDNQSGPRPHCALIDEVHEHKDDVVINMMRAGIKGRRQPLTVEITNSGVDKTTVCWQHHDYSTRVVTGQVPPVECDRWFAYVCALDDEDDPYTDESCWIKANPNLGVSIKKDYIRGQLNEAKGMPGKASLVMRLNFCRWVEAYSPWISAEAWLRCEDETINPDTWVGKRCAAGGDLSQKQDLTALAYAFDLGSGKVGAFVDIFTPQETLLDRERRDHVPYSLWAQQKHINLVPGKVIDYEVIAKHLLTRNGKYRPKDTAFDPYMMPYLQKELNDLAGNAAPQLVPHPQGAYKRQDTALWMPNSIEILEKLILSNNLIVVKNPCLTWNVSSAVLEMKTDQGSRLFTKRRSFGRIDGLVALAIAVGTLLTDSGKQVVGSIYNQIAARKKLEAQMSRPT